MNEWMKPGVSGHIYKNKINETYINSVVSKSPDQLIFFFLSRYAVVTVYLDWSVIQSKDNCKTRGKAFMGIDKSSGPSLGYSINQYVLSIQ